MNKFLIILPNNDFSTNNEMLFTVLPCAYGEFLACGQSAVAGAAPARVPFNRA